MKLFKHILLSATLVTVLVLVGCKNDDEPTPSAIETQLNLLMNGGANWTLSSSGVSKDGFDVTSQFTGFTLTLADKTYSTTHALPHVWPASGTWDFKDNNPNIVLRSDGTEVSVSISGNTLILTFMGPADPAERKEAISGEYTFHLTGN